MAQSCVNSIMRNEQSSVSLMLYARSAPTKREAVLYTGCVPDKQCRCARVKSSHQPHACTSHMHAPGTCVHQPHAHSRCVRAPATCVHQPYVRSSCVRTLATYVLQSCMRTSHIRTPDECALRPRARTSYLRTLATYVHQPHACTSHLHAPVTYCTPATCAPQPASTPVVRSRAPARRACPNQRCEKGATLRPAA